jgi:hypothetical protein
MTSPPGPGSPLLWCDRWHSLVRERLSRVQTKSPGEIGNRRGSTHTAMAGWATPHGSTILSSATLPQPYRAITAARGSAVIHNRRCGAPHADPFNLIRNFTQHHRHRNKNARPSLARFRKGERYALTALEIRAITRTCERTRVERLIRTLLEPRHNSSTWRPSGGSWLTELSATPTEWNPTSKCCE